MRRGKEVRLTSSTTEGGAGHGPPHEQARLLRAVAESSRVLIRNPDLAAAAVQAARLLGEAAAVDRVNVFRYDHDARAAALFADWCRAGVTSLRELDAGPFGYSDFEEVFRPTMAGEVYRAALREKSGRNYDLNARTDTLSDLHVPIFVESRFWGLLNLDDCTTERRWSCGEIELLRAAAEALAAAVRRQELEHDRRRQAEERTACADRLRRLMEAVVNASCFLLDEADFDAGVRRWLAEIAGAAGASRAAVGDYADGPITAAPPPVNRIAWAREGLAPADGFALPATADFDAWTERLRRGETVWAVYDDLTDPASRRYWEATGCRAGVIVPVAVDRIRSRWLYLDFEQARPRDPAVEAVLRTAAELLASALRWKRAVESAAAERSARDAAVLDERSRLAREFHDTVAQGLVGILMQARAAAAGGDVRGHLAVIERLAEENITEARRSVAALRRPVVGGQGLAEGLRGMVARLAGGTGMTVRFTAAEPLTADGFPVEDELFFIAQEAVGNAVRHSRGSRIEVDLTAGPEGVGLSVADDGVGFDPSATPAGRFGILGMAERAERSGGSLTVISEPGRGTLVVAVWNRGASAARPP